ncbi:MAG: hypothetical protein ABI162_02945, partial [Luteolibacter sp.]
MKSKNNTFLYLGFIALAFAGLAATSAQAAIDTWQGTAGSTDWATDGNWTYSTGSAIASGDSLVFTSANASPSTTLTNTLATSFNVAGITFNSGALAYTMTGNAFNLTGNITNNSASLQTINNAMTLTASRVLNATSGQLVLGGNITASQSLTLNPTNKITLAGTNTIATTATGTNTFYALLVNAGAGGVDITGSTTVGPGGATDRNG